MHLLKPPSSTSQVMMKYGPRYLLIVEETCIRALYMVVSTLIPAHPPLAPP
jgi:hypothetical protein